MSTIPGEDAVSSGVTIRSVPDDRDPSALPVTQRQQGNSELDETFVVNLIKSFGSMRAFEEAAAVTIDSMTSSGWLWLVKVDGRIEFRVSYAAGTIVSEHRLQSGQPSGLAFVNVEQTKPQPEVRSTADEPQSKREWSAEPSSKTVPVRAAHFSGPASTSPFDKQKSTIHPLACLSMHERAYLDTFGHGGKLEYFRRWLHALDFDKFNARLDLPVRHEQASLILRFNASLEQITPEEAEFTNEKLAAAKAYDDALQDPMERLYTTCPPSLLLRWADDTDVTNQGLRTEQSFRHFHWSEWAHGRLVASEEVSESTEVAAGEAAAAEGEASTSMTTASEGEAREETTAAAAAAEPSSSEPTAEEASASETEAAKDESPKSSP